MFLWFGELGFEIVAGTASPIGVFIEQKGGAGDTEVGTTNLGVPGGPGVPWWVLLPNFGFRQNP